MLWTYCLFCDCEIAPCNLQRWFDLQASETDWVEVGDDEDEDDEDEDDDEDDDDDDEDEDEDEEDDQKVISFVLHSMYLD